MGKTRTRLITRGSVSKALIKMAKQAETVEDFRLLGHEMSRQNVSDYGSVFAYGLMVQPGPEDESHFIQREGTGVPALFCTYHLAQKHKRKISKDRPYRITIMKVRIYAVGVMEDPNET